MLKLKRSLKMIEIMEFNEHFNINIEELLSTNTNDLETIIYSSFLFSTYSINLEYYKEFAEKYSLKDLTKLYLEGIDKFYNTNPSNLRKTLINNDYMGWTYNEVKNLTTLDMKAFKKKERNHGR